MILLVVGADRVDAGKTTFSAGLLDRTGAAGYKPPRRQRLLVRPRRLPSRPRRRAALWQKDAMRLTAADGRGRPPERLNPVHRLWRPTLMTEAAYSGGPIGSSSSTGSVAGRRVVIRPQRDHRDSERCRRRPSARGRDSRRDRRGVQRPRRTGVRPRVRTAGRRDRGRPRSPSSNPTATLRSRSRHLIPRRSPPSRPSNPVAFGYTTAIATVGPARSQAQAPETERSRNASPTHSTISIRSSASGCHHSTVTHGTIPHGSPARTITPTTRYSTLPDEYRSNRFPTALTALHEEPARKLEAGRAESLHLSRHLRRQFDVIVGVARHARSVTGVHRLEFRIDPLEHRSMLSIRASRSPPPRDRCGRSSRSGRRDRPRTTRSRRSSENRGDRPCVPACGARRTRGRPVEPSPRPRSRGRRRRLRCRTPGVDIKGVFHRREVSNVIAVRMRQDDGVDVVDSIVNGVDEVEVRTRIDEHGPVAGDEKDVAGKRLYAFCEVRDHGWRYSVE